MNLKVYVTLACCAAIAGAPHRLAAQAPSPKATAPAAGTPSGPPPAGNAAAATTPPAAAVPAGYLIGADDILTIVFWREKDMSGDVTVRPDGRISVPLVNEVVAAGLTPEQLREKLTAEAERFVQDPSVSVVVKQINSRKVFITGEINKPGPYQLGDRMTVLQLIALAGGLNDFADKENIVVMRNEKRADGTPQSYRVNYKELIKRQKLTQNIELKPGDTVIVP